MVLLLSGQTVGLNLCFEVEVGRPCARLGSGFAPTFPEFIRAMYAFPAPGLQTPRQRWHVRIVTGWAANSARRSSLKLVRIFEVSFSSPLRTVKEYDADGAWADFGSVGTEIGHSAQQCSWTGTLADAGAARAGTCAYWPGAARFVV